MYDLLLPGLEKATMGASRSVHVVRTAQGLRQGTDQPVDTWHTPLLAA